MATKQRNSVETSDRLIELHDVDAASDGAVSSKRSFSRLSRLMPQRWSKSGPQKRRSILGALAVSVAVIPIGLTVLWVYLGLVNSSEQRALHRAPLHRDDSVIRTGVTAQYKRSVALYYRDVNGTPRLRLADEDGVNKFVNETLTYLETECERIKANTAAQIAALLAMAFEDRDSAITAYADWYFAWGRSWALLKEATLGGVEGFAPNNVQGVVEASRNRVEAYLIRHYQRYVLKPELRNHVLETGIARILAEAHQEYLAVVATLDDRVQDYLNKETQALDPRDPLAKLDIALGWDQQKWKAPRYAADDRASVTAARGAVVTLIALSVKPGVERAVAPIFAKAASRTVTAIRPQVIGVAAGTMIEPGLGTAAGWVIGLGSGVAIDYLWDKGEECLDRSAFEHANAEALDATIREWSHAMRRDLFKAVDAWFEDTRGVVADFKLQRKIPTG